MASNMAESEKTYEIHGVVTGREGRLLSGARVVVWWQHIRERTKLAQTETSEHGRYDVEFRVPEALAQSMVLLVEALSEYLDAALYSPPTQAVPRLEINLRYEALDQSEWATLVRAIEPLLEGLKLSELVENSTHQDITFLAREVGKDTETVMRVAVSTRLNAVFPVPAPAFYAFLRQHIPAALPSPLLDASQSFTLIDSLVHRIGSLIFGLSAATQTQTLTAAAALNFIGPQFTTQTRQIVAELQAQRTTDLLRQPYLIGNASLGQLLVVAQLSENKQQSFAQALATNTLSMRNFWRTLGDGQHGFTTAEASSIERTLSIGAFVKNHLPLVQILMQGFTIGTYASLADLAKLGQQFWIDLVNRVGAPANIEGTPTASPAEVFARVVYARITCAYPTAALSNRLAAGGLVPDSQQGPVVRFFQNNTALELVKDNIAVYLANRGDTAFTGIAEADRPVVTANARRFQRVLRVAPQVDAATTLIKLGIQSAAQIATMGRQQFFVIATKAGLTKPEANQAYSVAAQRYAGTVSLYTQFNRDAIGLWPKGIGNLNDLNQPIQQAIQRDQSLATLFGSMDYCEADSCTSVLSPTAYLCDLLLWLRNHPQGGKTALDVLDGRRADIRHLLLNCPNSETSLPYIDLVNELLADVISPPTDPNSTTNPIWKQTSADKTADELRAAPEYFNQGAYVTLFGASYPQTLPYSAGLDELRTYTQQLSVPLWQIRQALLPLHGPTPAQKAAVASERFRMAPHAMDLIATADPSIAGLKIAWNTANPAIDLAAVPTFLQAGSITYESFLELLQVAWVQGGLNITIQGVNDLCDTSVQTLSPAPLPDFLEFLDRAHRFLVLWQLTGYKMWELGLLMASSAVGSDTLNESALGALLDFQMLRDATGLSVDAQLAFYQDIDTATYRDPDGTTTTSLYTRLFLYPTVTAAAPDADLVALASGGAIQHPALADHLPAIQAALGVSASDASILFSLTNGQLTLANLSTVYRVSSLATAARLAIPDLLNIALALDPGAANPAAALAPLLAAPSATLAFLAQAAVVRSSGFTLDALTYLRTAPPWATTTQMTQADITTALVAVQQAIVASAGINTAGAVIAAVAANGHRPADPGLANDVTALVLQTLLVPGLGQTLLTVLTDPSLTALLAGNLPPITQASFPNQFLAIQLFDKTAVISRQLRLVAAEMSWLLTNAAVYGGLDVTQLPVVSAQAALGLTPFLTTLMLVKLARLFRAAPPQSTIQTLFDVIGGVAAGTLPNEAGVQAALATITGWPLADIVSYAGSLGVAFPADYKAPATYDALRTLAAMAAKTTAIGPQLVAWSAVPADEPTAETMAASALGVLKAQYPNIDAWLKVAPTLMDPIRERRSAALQAYLIGLRDNTGKLVYGDTNGLFDSLLIDVQMSACQVTTRVVQAYVAVQIFVERCLMNLEAPSVLVDLMQDDTWSDWQWMKRYRIWEANREVFLYPENWLIESQRPNRTEIYQQFEQGVRQGELTADYLESVVMNYIDALNGIAHLLVTGTCEDPASNDIYVVARSLADPPTYYLRSFTSGAWTGWAKIPLDIKAQQAVPALYRGRVCVFWVEVKVNHEPNQNLPAPQTSSSPPNQYVAKYVALTVYFSIFRNGTWTPAQAAKGKLFDLPLPLYGSLAGLGLPVPASPQVSDSKTIESFYTIKVNAPAPTPGYGGSLFVDVFRIGALRTHQSGDLTVVDNVDPSRAVHLGRALFDGRFNDLELRNLPVQDNFTNFFGTLVPIADGLLAHAQATYGPDAQPLLPLPENQADPDLVGEPNLVPFAGALATTPANPTQGSNQTVQLTFTSVSALEQNVGHLLNAAPLPFRVVGPVSDLQFDPGTYFFFQDNRRCYYVESDKTYWTGSWWSPTAPSNPGTVPFQVKYGFHRMYHPFTELFWHQLAGGGFPLLYSRNLQLNPDQIDSSGADAFGFQSGYQPVIPTVWWDNDDFTGQDREFLDFSYSTSYAVYNWELFFHIPLYVAQLLSQNQQFEDSMAWFHYVFNPTQQGSDPVPQRFWIPKPLNTLTSAAILGERINNLLVAVNQGDPTAIAQVQSWRQDPFNPFLLADQRPVAYMKRTVMSYLDNLIAWADNLFSSESREALSEATLLYVIASEILGPQPAAITPPKHADESYDQLEPKLDAFANAMVDIENVLGGATGGGGVGGIPPPQTFFFKIPPNDTLLGYWTTVADRLYKLRHCQNIQGAALQLALFDAPIDPGLLVAARAAGVDLGSVMGDLTASLPNYRFTALYPQALDFVNAVRAYGALLLAAFEKSDADQLGVLTTSNQLQLLQAADQIFEWQIEQAQHNLDYLNQGLELAKERYTYWSTLPRSNTAEGLSAELAQLAFLTKYGVPALKGLAAMGHALPNFNAGVTGMGGTPAAHAAEGGNNAGHSSDKGADVLQILVSLMEDGSKLLFEQGRLDYRYSDNQQIAAEAQFQIDQTNAQIAGAQVALSIAQQNQTNHQTQEDQLQKQIDFLTDKFTNQDLYDWMVGQLSATYFQSYRMAYRLCKQLEACYRFELGISDSSFIQFGYWDSLHKGLLAAEGLNHDLRRMQSSYLDQNARRFEISRFISLGVLNPGALQQLLLTGACDFDLSELLFDTDYPGLFNRHLVRMSVTVVYPNPGKFDNVKATLTLVANKVRTSTDLGAGYAENPVGSDTRFTYAYAAVPQKIVLGNAQDDSGLFLTAIVNNLSDQRYLPFENAGAISSWHFEMLQASNEIDISTVGDVVLHIYYTAMDGGNSLKQAAQQNVAQNAPTSGVKWFSSQNDFPAPWALFVATPASGADQLLKVGIAPTRFPPWTRGKTITVSSLTVLAVNWTPESFLLEPQAPLPNADVTLTPLAGTTEPNICAGTVVMPLNTPLGTWSFKLRKQTAADFHSLTGNDIGDVILLVNYQVS